MNTRFFGQLTDGGSNNRLAWFNFAAKTSEFLLAKASSLEAQ